MWNEDGTILGVKTIQDGKEFWTVKGIPAGTSELNLTVIYATQEEMKDLPPVMPPVPVSRLARAAAGTTPVYIKTWLQNGKTPGSHTVTNPVDGVEVTAKYEFASQLKQEDGYTLWYILVVINQGGVSKDTIINMGITFGTKTEDPDPGDLTQAKADANKAVDEYKATEIAGLTGEKATAAQGAKDAAKAAIEAATTQAEIDKAVADYKAAIDELVAATGELTVKATDDKTKVLEKYPFEFQIGRASCRERV